jgi:hypothetical protein
MWIMTQMSRSNTNAGDRIALFEGGKVPYILRLRIGKEYEHELIGEAYVHGIIGGEAWNPDDLADIILA